METTLIRMVYQICQPIQIAKGLGINPLLEKKDLVVKFVFEETDE